MNQRNPEHDLHAAAANLEVWNFRLYVAGQSPMSIAAFNNLKRICEEHLSGRYRIQVVDLRINPKLARDDQILAIPSLVRVFPMPTRKIIGALSDTERVIGTLQIRTELMNGH